MSMLKCGDRLSPSTPSEHSRSLSLYPAFKNVIRKRRLFSRGDRIVAAVSGGPDSICLLHLLQRLSREWGLEIHVAHFDHCLRGEESEQDAVFTGGVSRDLGLEFHSGRGDVRTRARDMAVSIQEAARSLRYEFLDRVRTATGSGFIATGHTADDQAEEVLLRLIRGAGLPGMSGIPWTTDRKIVRPMLEIRKSQILEYLDSEGIGFRVDQSNYSETYLRNRIRMRLIPVLERHFNPSIVRTVNRMADMLQEDSEVLETMAEETYNRSVRTGPAEGMAVFSTDALRSAPPPIRRRAYRKALMELGLFSGRITGDHLRSIDALVCGKAPGACCTLPGCRVSRRYDDLIISGGINRPELPDFQRASRVVKITGPGRWPAPVGGTWVDIAVTEISREFRRRDSGQMFQPLWMDPGSVRFPLILRTRRPGERFWPYGASSPLKLKRFLISRKIPRDIRDCIPLLADENGGIVAVVGIEIAHPFRLRETRGKAVSVEWRRAGEREPALFLR